MRRSIRDSYPLSMSDLMKYRQKARGMSLFQKDCAVMGIDAGAMGFRTSGRSETGGYHRPMDFLGGDEAPPPPRRAFSGMNADE